MYYISETTAERIVGQAAVTSAIEEVFRSMAAGTARNFPVVRETLGFKDAVFGFKSGFDLSEANLGVKMGGLWPGNHAILLANHQSTIVLVDPQTGGPKAFVRGNYLTALRTAAVGALSIRYLARESADSLGIIGAGGQAEYQIRAALLERPFREIAIWSRTRAQAELLHSRLADLPVKVSLGNLEDVVRRSDVVITVTPSRKPLVKAAWLKDGAHIACMGADTKGKQEVETEVVKTAKLFGDETTQNVTIGECQHAFAEGFISQEEIIPIGAVIQGAHAGRTSEQEITLFDSTGVGLQDIAAAALALRLALEKDVALELD